MAAQSNVAGMARFLYLVVGLGVAAWGIWGAADDWMRYTALAVGGILVVLAIIGYSPLHAMMGANPKGEKTS